MSTSKTTRYDRPADWEAWHDLLISTAKSLDMHDILLGRTEPPRTPIRPDRRAYYSRPASSGPRTRSTPPGDAALEAPVPTPITVDGFTYSEAWNVYQDEQRIYEAYKRGHTQLHGFITESVSEAYRAKWCHCEDGLPRWYQNLTAGAVLTKQGRIQEAKAKYAAAVKPLKTMPRDFELWISNWESAMIQGIRHRLNVALDEEVWVRDLIEALQLVKPQFAETFRAQARAEQKVNTLTYQFAIEELRSSTSYHTKTAQSKFTHGSFAASEDHESFAIDHDNDNDDIEGPASRPAPRTRTPRRTNTKPPNADKRMTIYQPNQAKRGPEFDSNEERPTKRNQLSIRGSGQQQLSIRGSGQQNCILCTMNHAMEVCFYIVPPLPQQMPRPWKPNRTVLSMIEARLETDPELREKVERIRRDVTERREAAERRQ